MENNIMMILNSPPRMGGVSKAAQRYWEAQCQYGPAALMHSQLTCEGDVVPGGTKHNY